MSGDGGERLEAKRQAATALLADNSTYHNHKEQMAYLGAAAYIGAAATFIFSRRHAPLTVPFIVLIAWTAVAGLIYVWWQLQRREQAAERSMEYYNALVEFLPSAKRPDFARFPATCLSRLLMLLTMLAWGLCAFFEALRPGSIYGS